MMADKIVAFICTHNACRSQIAEALARREHLPHLVFLGANNHVSDYHQADEVR